MLLSPNNDNFSRKPRDIKELNLLPLINVVFLLLIFFMVAGTIAGPDSVPINLPKAMDSEAPLEEDLVLVIDPSGNVWKDEKQLDDVNLHITLSKLLLPNREQTITLKADQELPAATLTTLLKKIEAAGGKNITLVTEAK